MDARRFSIQALLWLEVLALAVSVLHFAFAPGSVHRPMLAALALALLASMTILVRVLPLRSRPPGLQQWIEIALLTLSITMLAAATGALYSALLTLYLVPLVGIALAFGRWWQVPLLALAIALLCVGLGALTPDLEVLAPEFAVLLLSAVAPGAGVAVVLAVLIARMQTAERHIDDLAATDAMTGLLNLRAFEQVLQQKHREAERLGQPYTLVAVDIDNLAQVNEVIGYDAGNEVLMAIAAAIGRSIRSSDVAARFGGDEFMVLLMDAQAETGAAIAQRIRNNVYHSAVSVANRLIRVNVSVGCATYPDDHLQAKELMILADQRMQRDADLRRPVSA